MKNIEIVVKKLDELVPYENNPRNNEEAVSKVAASIEEFGFKVPIIVDADGVIVAGHTRFLAAKELGMDEVPCIVADDLNEEQIKAFRLADNKVSEFSTWDFEKLDLELSELADFEMQDFGFEEPEQIDWANVDDLHEDSYKEPEATYLKCPHCGHVDMQEKFDKVKE